MVEFRKVCAGYGDRAILRDVSFSIEPCQVVSFVGPNGCGKTTLLRSAVKQLPLISGEIILKGKPIDDYGRKEFAKTAAFMPQIRPVPKVSVEAMVSYGRYPYLGISRQLSRADAEAVEQAMEETAVVSWRHRNLAELSGGERQRVYIAMALAQGTDVVFFDEPATYLDINRQFELLELIRSLKNKGKTVVMVLHDLSHAMSYSDKIALADGGRLAMYGTPEEIYDSGMLGEVFNVEIHRDGDMYYFSPKR